LIRKGAQLLIVPTMDVADWGLHQHELHALVAPVRAAEYGIPIFRLASSGISQAVTVDGHTLATAPFMGEGKSLFATIALSAHASLPLDRYLAPVAVGITGILVLVLRFGKPTAKSTVSREGNSETEKESPEKLRLRIYGDASQPTLIYLPGLHGDWTLVGSFRRALANRVRFVEITYPRTLIWSLDDYAANIETALAEKGITRGWLLGESFGSQIVWPLLERKRFAIEGIILAGGFVRHPMCGTARLVQRIAGAVPLSIVIMIMFTYAKVARWRYRHSPETHADIHEFIARRSVELDRRAAVHRLELLSRNDPSYIAKNACLPIYALSGVLDPIVPWFFVRPWLRDNCPALREYKIFRSADHNVLGTAPDAAAEQVMQWMNEMRNAERGMRNPG
jgi:pimeloyl-ACP methyl ester carboxylesterase